jgi:anti-sigma factor RsiW
MKKTAKCREVFRYICENLDDDLDSPECREIKRHLDGCPNCLAYLDSLKKTVMLYQAFPHPRLTKKARKRIHSGLRQSVMSTRS